MNYDEHLPPHFHAAYGSEEAQILIATGQIMNGSLPGRAAALVRQWAQLAPRGTGRRLETARRNETSETNRPAAVRPKLKTLRSNGDFRIAFTYEDGLVVELDFSDHLARRSGPMVEPLHDERFFSQAYIDHGALTWPNGYDVCPDVLRVWAEAGSILSPAETDRRCAERREAGQPVA